MTMKLNIIELHQKYLQEFENAQTSLRDSSVNVIKLITSPLKIDNVLYHYFDQYHYFDHLKS
jgi:hypothetical protein